jgi:hypothetical protein
MNLDMDWKMIFLSFPPAYRLPAGRQVRQIL